jgi:hypothetical protein
MTSRDRNSNRIFIFLPMRAMMPRSRPSNGRFWTDHGARTGLSFSFSAYCWALENRGRLLDMRRMWRVKKPLFWVEKDGYPLLPARFSRADSHMTGVAVDPV